MDSLNTENPPILVVPFYSLTHLLRGRLFWQMICYQLIRSGWKRALKVTSVVAISITHSSTPQLSFLLIHFNEPKPPECVCLCVREYVSMWERARERERACEFECCWWLTKSLPSKMGLSVCACVCVRVGGVGGGGGGGGALTTTEGHSAVLPWQPRSHSLPLSNCCIRCGFERTLLSVFCWWNEIFQ